MTDEPATASGETCPRRMLDLGPWKRAEGLDGYADGQYGGPHCTFCGSLHPDRFMELLREGWGLGPTDKTYKAYLKGPAGETKFYYHHLSPEQRNEFIEMYNSQSLTITYPGHLYVAPFFAKLAET